VIFADLSGFTAMAEQLSLKGAEGAEELARSLDSFFESLFEVIADFGGQVIKIAGDAPFVVWKAEEDLASTVALAARCALAMSKHTLGPSSLRIGLGAGEVVLASVGGVRDRWEFFLAGQPLAQVAQAERLAEPGQVVVSPEARLHLGLDYAFAGPVLVDGPKQTTRLVPAYGDHPLPRGYVDAGVLSRLQAGGLALYELGRGPEAQAMLCELPGLWR
jgi:class 3 adenylate cyclase